MLKILFTVGSAQRGGLVEREACVEVGNVAERKSSYAKSASGHLGAFLTPLPGPGSHSSGE